MRKKKYNLENRKHFVYFAIIYTCICVTVMAFTVFFQYRAYTKNYNVTVAKLCALIHEKYPDVSDGSIAGILNDSSIDSDDTNLKAAETFLKKYGIDMEKDSAVLSNEKALKGALGLDIFLVVLFAGGFCLYIMIMRLSFKRQVRQAADYLRRINQGDYRLVMSDSTEGELSILKGELYKTAIYLRESAENAKTDKLLLKDALSDISHQLKTPLTSLSINLENLEGNPDMAPENRNRIMRRAKRDVDNISHMVQAILKLSRLEADVVEFDEKDILLSEIVAEAADNVMALCDLRDVRLSIDEGSDKDACIHADAYWQCEAITNIVKNAVEHAESEVRIGFYRYEMYAEITVQNDGETISDEDKKHIFTRFYSGSGQPADSIGIGLSLAEAIVRYDNGYILVEDCKKDILKDTLNEKNECSGTRFVVRYL